MNPRAAADALQSAHAIRALVQELPADQQDAATAALVDQLVALHSRGGELPAWLRHIVKHGLPPESGGIPN